MTLRTPPAGLYDLLACPVCKTPVSRADRSLVCASCRRTYPIVDEVPILFPDGRAAEYQHQHDLTVRSGYLPWIERVVMQSLPPDAIVLDLGAGNRAYNLPHVIRMDVTRTPFVDVVGDAHALPFLPGSLDFIFSLAVIEHLRQPFLAAQEMASALRDGGYVYGECNFVFPYHGFPHHYFNASQQGLEQVFAPFMRLRSGVAPYQMPSFAVRSVLSEYRVRLERLAADQTRDARRLIEELSAQPLATFDRFFPEDQAAHLAAGVFFFGVKSADGRSDVIPPSVQRAWHETPDLQRQFPQLLDLGHAGNVMRWAKSAGRAQRQDIASELDARPPFRKAPNIDDADLRAFEAEPVVEPAFGHIPDEAATPPGRLERWLDRIRRRLT